MLIRKIISIVGLAGVLLFVPLTAAHAASGLYLGASWGAYQINESNLDDNDDLWKAFIGVQANDLLGIEASRVDFSRTESTNSSFKGDGLGLAAVFSFPIGGGSTFFAKAGQFWWDSESSFGGAPGDPDGNDPFYGVGLKFGKGLSLRLELERYKVADVDLDTVTVGLQLGF